MTQKLEFTLLPEGWYVGDFRDKRGFYRDFVSTTISAFRDCGAELYNEAILVTSVGSASMRVTKQFQSGRKFAKTHQTAIQQW